MRLVRAPPRSVDSDSSFGQRLSKSMLLGTSRTIAHPLESLNVGECRSNAILALCWFRWSYKSSAMRRKFPQDVPRVNPSIHSVPLFMKILDNVRESAACNYRIRWTAQPSGRIVEVPRTLGSVGPCNCETRNRSKSIYLPTQTLVATLLK